MHAPIYLLNRYLKNVEEVFEKMLIMYIKMLIKHLKKNCSHVRVLCCRGTVFSEYIDVKGIRKLHVNYSRPLWGELHQDEEGTVRNVNAV